MKIMIIKKATSKFGRRVFLLEQSLHDPHLYEKLKEYLTRHVMVYNLKN